MRPSNVQSIRMIAPKYMLCKSDLLVVLFGLSKKTGILLQKSQGVTYHYLKRQDLYIVAVSCHDVSAVATIEFLTRSYVLETVLFV